MNLLERLIEDHGRLRRSLAAMNDFLHGEECSNAEHLGEAAMRRVFEMERTFREDLIIHEQLEERFFKAALQETGQTALFQRICGEHESINDVFKVLAALSGPSGGENSYSIRFAVSSLVFNLEQHLRHEEAEIFPLLKRALSASQLETAGARVE